MATYIPTREDAFKLFKEYNKSENLTKHALSVEAVMIHFAELLGLEDVNKWGIIGLVHDIDYEMYPEEHCVKAREILSERNWPEDYIHAIQSHGYKICSEVEPIGIMEKVLYTIDEITGLITATVLMRPSKSILDLELKSVKKKWKDIRFAAGVDRDLIEGGAKLLGMELEYIISETIKGMQKVAEEIGLKGEL
ncbi:putative nucleotidyltransferase with HDIG domain [Clostridium punense]|uniref:Nucleotidyltransferase with HDIG domain n=1 Tax=Clostridium punense TaxID=1054297 RepID=A0ABS4K0X3_9CLOT|nr:MULTISPECIES: HDIG domain-containing metalloprotein [Clostridium]EQB89057.1 hydrolase [Clostridium sp. BL8]MBP2021427.1 putative nucleotidyltransferase with HDIG domain [Clostridium punense]